MRPNVPTLTDAGTSIELGAMNLSADGGDESDVKLKSVDLWILESILGLNRESTLKSSRSQRLYHILRQIRHLQKSLQQHCHFLTIWTSQINNLLRIDSDKKVSVSITTFQKLIQSICCIMGSFQPESEPRPESLQQAQYQWLTRAHDLFAPTPETAAYPTPVQPETLWQRRERDPIQFEPVQQLELKTDVNSSESNPIVSDGSSSSSDNDDVPPDEVHLDIDDDALLETSHVSLDVRIRDQIQRLRHVDPRPEYQPQIPLGRVVQHHPASRSTLLTRIQEQRRKLRSVPTRTSSVHVGRVIPPRSQSATRSGSLTPSRSISPYGSEGDVIGQPNPAVLTRRSVPIPRCRLSRRGQFQEAMALAMISKREIRTPSVRIPGL